MYLAKIPSVSNGNGPLLENPGASQALVSATRMVKNPIVQRRMVAQGRVYCDRCRVGFETRKTRNMVGAKVKIDALNRRPTKWCTGGRDTQTQLDNTSLLCLRITWIKPVMLTL